MSLEQIQHTFLNLLSKANRSGAFELEDSNSAILALNALAQVINQQNQLSTMDNNPPIPPDPSKPKPE